MCQRDNNPTKEQITAEDHQWVFNATRNYRTRSRDSVSSETKMYISSVIMDFILNFEKNIKETKIKNHTRQTQVRGS